MISSRYSYMVERFKALACGDIRRVADEEPATTTKGNAVHARPGIEAACFPSDSRAAGAARCRHLPRRLNRRRSRRRAAKRPAGSRRRIRRGAA